MRKRVNGFFLVLMMVSMLLVNSVAFPIAGFAGEGPIVINGAVNIKSYSVDETAIYEGDSFGLAIVLENNSSKTISSVKIRFDTNASFQVNGLSNPVTVDFPIPEPIPMLYTGGTNLNIPVTIEYEFSDGDYGSTSSNLYIKEAKPETDTGGGNNPPPDLSKYKPVLELGSSDIPTGKAGGIIRIPLSITNNSNYEARNIKITPKIDDLPFEIDQITMYKTVNKLLANQSTDVDFQFKIKKDAEKKTYTLPLTIEYKNMYNIAFTEEKVIYISIDNTNLPPQLVVREAVSNPAEIKPEENFTVTFDVWNMGTIEAENVIVDLDSSDNFYIMDSITKKYLFELKGLQNEKITYTLRPKKGLETGTYGITISLKHKDMAAAEKYTMYVNVLTESEEEEADENVNIITENIITPQASVLTEQPFTVSFDIKNIGTTKAKDVKVTIDSGDKILPQSLNMLSISEIDAGGSINSVFSFIASKDCETRSYPIKAIIEYKNGEEMVKKEQYMGVLIEKVKDEEEDDKGTLNTVPKIIISEYSSEPGMVNAGENLHSA